MTTNRRAHPTETPDIVLDDVGLSYLAGSDCRVRLLGLERGMGLTPLQIRERHPDLTEPQIEKALCYYRDHWQRMEFEALLDGARSPSGWPALRPSPPP